jgi:PLP dependent protein
LTIHYSLFTIDHLPAGRQVHHSPHLPMVNKAVFLEIKNELVKSNTTLVAVSKTKPASDILELYNLGQRDFGENYVQEMAEKASQLPADIRWHFIGHLQSNKVKYIAPFVHLVHGVDSLKLLEEINKQGKKNNRLILVLLQIHIAREETKYGLDEQELHQLLEYLKAKPLDHVRICGLMGMATFTDNAQIVESEFTDLARLFHKYGHLNTPGISFNTLSMGMSADYKTALKHGSNLVRIGSLLFGER